MRKICVENSAISLLYTSVEDMDLVYKMAMDVTDEEEGMNEYFFNGETYDEFRAGSDETIFFTGAANKSNYLLIQYDSQIIGAIAHTFNDAPIKNMEIHIWLRSMNYLGKELGPKSIQLLITYLRETYKITTFLIRPSVDNVRAVKAYFKCGFIHHKDFDSRRYYSPENSILYGKGHFGVENTYNMVLQF